MTDRASNESNSQDEQLIARYRANYSISDDVALTEEQVRYHLELERALTDELRASTRETRHETFKRCYDELYAKLPWLASTGTPTDVDTSQWTAALGPPPLRIYEVGSGAGALARGLALEGYEIEATEITLERGGAGQDPAGLTWSVTDGVNVDRFASSPPYDAVISDQVVEHLHTDDVVLHFSGCLSILKPGGLLLFRTPHAFTGPHDVSRVFGFQTSVGMHMREYTNRELVARLREAGFSKIKAVLPFPPLAKRGRRAAFVSGAYLRLLLTLEAVLGRFDVSRRVKLTRLLPGPAKPRIFLAARVPASPRQRETTGQTTASALENDER